jgi:hypothetical protein
MAVPGAQPPSDRLPPGPRLEAQAGATASGGIGKALVWTVVGGSLLAVGVMAGVVVGKSKAERAAAGAEAGKDDGVTVKGKPARLWAEQLKDRDFNNRFQAASALQECGSQARPWASDVEAALKNASWDIVLLVGEAGSEPVTFTSVGGLPQRSAYATDAEYQKALAQFQQRAKDAEEKGRQREEKRRQFELKVQKQTDYLAALVGALEKADPERLAALGLGGSKTKQFLDALTLPQQQKTFTTVSNTIGGTSNQTFTNPVLNSAGEPQPGGKGKNAGKQ